MSQKQQEISDHIKQNLRAQKPDNIPAAHGELKAFLEKRERERPYRKESVSLAIQTLSAMRVANISTTALAEFMDISKNEIDKILSGSERFTKETIEKIEIVLCIKLHVNT